MSSHIEDSMLLYKANRDQALLSPTTPAAQVPWEQRHSWGKCRRKQDKSMSISRFRGFSKVKILLKIRSSRDKSMKGLHLFPKRSRRCFQGRSMDLIIRVLVHHMSSNTATASLRVHSASLTAMALTPSRSSAIYSSPSSQFRSNSSLCSTWTRRGLIWQKEAKLSRPKSNLRTS